MWSSSRPAPPDGPPPRYATVMKKVYPYSLRPIVIVTACLGFIWAMVMGVNELQDRGQPNATSKQKLMALIQAILFFIIALVEAILFVIAIMQNVAFGRTIMVLAPLGVILTLGTQIVNLVMHWSLKGDLINQCTLNTAGATYTSSGGAVQTVTSDQARTICTAAWDRGTWSVIAWLIASLVLAGIFASVAMSYYRQLLDPTSVRQRRAQAEVYPLQSTYNPHNAYANNPPPPQGQGYQHGPPPGQQQAWMVPPYPGPPTSGEEGSKGYEKGDYHPEAEWANYGAPPPPAGSPPRRGPEGMQSGFGGERAQDDAWARAESSGPTAHFTGHGRNRSQGDEEGAGYVVKNVEEDEAWERARREGVTAHLTGTGPNRKE